MVPAPNRTSSERQVFERTVFFVVASLGMGLLFDLLLFDKLPGISFPLFVVLTLGFIFGSAHVQRRTIPKPALFMIPLLLFFSSMVFVRASEGLIFFNIVISLYLLMMFVALVFKPRLGLYRLKDYIGEALRVPLRAFQSVQGGLAPLMARSNFVTAHPTLPGVLRGVVIALPVLLLFVLLFSSADLVFRQYVTDIFSFNVNIELFWRIVLIFAVAIGFFGLFTLLGRKQEPAGHDEQEATVAHGGKGALTEVTILFGSLNVLFFSCLA